MKVCDYHCENMIDRGGYEEFDNPPFDLFPCEVLAIYAVRSRLGLATPKIEHPLMDTPPGSIALRKVEEVDDPLLERVEKLYRDVFEMKR